MDQMRREARRDAARRRLERTRERAGRARIRALVLPIGLFGIVWVAVFAQMATGNDPALSNNPKGATSGKAAASGSKTAAASGAGAPAKPRRQKVATVLAYDPVTGTIVRIPASSAQTAVTTPAPAPAPVITSQS